MIMDDEQNGDPRIATMGNQTTLVPGTPTNPAATAAAARILGNPEQRPSVRWTSAEELILLEAINSYKTPGSAYMNKEEAQKCFAHLWTILDNGVIRLNRTREAIETKIGALKSKYVAFSWFRNVGYIYIYISIYLSILYYIILY